MSAAGRASHRAYPRAPWWRAAQGAIRLAAALALTGTVAAQAHALLRACSTDGRLPAGRTGELQQLVSLLESGLA